MPAPGIELGLAAGVSWLQYADCYYLLKEIERIRHVLTAGIVPFCVFFYKNDLRIEDGRSIFFAIEKQHG